jgi:hypoxanthine phosphoribosyltransferase
MKKAQVKDLTFDIFLPHSEIQNKIKDIAQKIELDYAGKKPILVGILNGSFRFLADLVNYLSLPIQVCFVKVASYHGTSSTGQIKRLIGLDIDIENQDVIIIEDIVDTGLTMVEILRDLNHQHPASLEIVTLLVKPDKLQAKLNLKYVGFSIPNEFVVGYGLDYDGLGRELNDIYKLG